MLKYYNNYMCVLKQRRELTSCQVNRFQIKSDRYESNRLSQSVAVSVSVTKDYDKLYIIIQQLLKLLRNLCKITLIFFYLFAKT